jgi:hypothetical protein
MIVANLFIRLTDCVGDKYREVFPLYNPNTITFASTIIGSLLALFQLSPAFHIIRKSYQNDKSPQTIPSPRPISQNRQSRDHGRLYPRLLQRQGQLRRLYWPWGRRLLVQSNGSLDHRQLRRART